MSTNIELMQHALGINERNREPYRNYFLASTESSDSNVWETLVEQGFATSHPAPKHTCGDVVYRVTETGQVAAISALPEPKKRTRYDDYLHSEVVESFGEWLGVNLPKFEYREVDYIRGKWEYRMYRCSRCYWDSYRDVEGDWKPTKKAAKASYKEALKKRKESTHD